MTETKKSGGGQIIKLALVLLAVAAVIAMVLGVYVLFASLKTSTVFLGYWIGRQDGRNGFLSAVGLTAMGEFAFIIAKEALDFGVVDDGFYTSIIGAALVSMVSLPILTRSSDKIWNKFESGCPAFMRKGIESANGFREDLYSSIDSTNKRARKTLRRGMTYVYVDVLLIILIEIIFYAAVPMLSPVMDDMYGGGVHAWDFIFVMLNFVVLIPPIWYMVEGLRRLDRLIVDWSRDMADWSGRGRPNVYAEMLEISTFAVVAIIDLALIVIIPNPLTLAEHLFVAVAAVLIVVILICRRRKRRAAAMKSSESSEEERN